MICRAARWDDVKAIQVRPMEAEAQRLAIQKFEQMTLIHEYLADWALTLEHEGTTLAVGGAIPSLEARCEIWAMLTDEVLSSITNLKALHRAAWDLLGRLEKIGMQRIEAVVMEDHQEGIRWMENFGFDFEGLMPKYLPDGGTGLRFARIH